MNFPDLNQLLESLALPPWVEPETRTDASVRLLAHLSDLPSWKWSKQHWQVKAWYDKCYEQVRKTGELFTYPVQRDVVFNHQNFFESVLRLHPLPARAAQLILTQPNLTGDKIYEILKLEGFHPKPASCRVMVRSMQVLLGLLAKQSIVDLQTLYPKT